MPTMVGQSDPSPNSREQSKLNTVQTVVVITAVVLAKHL